MISFNMNAEPLQAQHAVLLYGKNHASAQYASVHEVQTGEDGKLSLAAGLPVTESALKSMFESLDPNRIEKPTFNDARILSRGPGWLVWWMRPQSIRVWFNAKQIGERTEVVPHPGLVFSVSRRGWQVFALAGRDRPRPGTALFQAPYFNVWSRGKICEGSAATPTGNKARNPDEWERAFFDSRFSHPNIHEKDRLVKYRGGPVKFWQAMLNGRFERFPKEVLVPAEMTVSDLLADIGRAS